MQIIYLIIVLHQGKKLKNVYNCFSWYRFSNEICNKLARRNKLNKK